MAKRKFKLNEIDDSMARMIIGMNAAAVGLNTFAMVSVGGIFSDTMSPERILLVAVNAACIIFAKASTRQRRKRELESDDYATKKLEIEK